MDKLTAAAALHSALRELDRVASTDALQRVADAVAVLAAPEEAPAPAPAEGG
jgi:hypothetical protein